MKADALWVVVTPQGHAADCAAYDRDLAAHRYLMEWMPEGVKPDTYVLDRLWEAFEKAGYKVHRVNLPPAVEGRGVCRT